MEFVGSPDGGREPCWAPQLAALKARRRKSRPCPRLLETGVLRASDVKCTQGLEMVLCSLRDQHAPQRRGYTRSLPMGAIDGTHGCPQKT
eukprot:gene16083-biopygen6727